MGEELTIADIVWFPSVRSIDATFHAKEYFEFDKRYPNVNKWFNRINSLPQVQKGLTVNNLKDRVDYHSE